MGNGYSIPASDPVDQLMRELGDLRRRVSEVEAFTGSEISETVANQVSPSVASASSSNFSLSTSYSTVSSTTITIPTDFTRALVVVVAGVSGATGGTGGDRLYGRVVIDGTGGPEIIQALLVNAFVGSISPSYTRSLTGLTPGGSVSVSVQAKLELGPNNALFQQYNTAAISANAMFLR